MSDLVTRIARLMAEEARLLDLPWYERKQEELDDVRAALVTAWNRRRAELAGADPRPAPAANPESGYGAAAEKRRRNAP